MLLVYIKCELIHFEGTLFIGGGYSVNWTKEVIHSAIRSNFSPALGPSSDGWEQTITNLVESYLYDDPSSFGSPFNSGNDTFGLSQGYKIISAISNIFLASYLSLPLIYCLVGDLMFTGQRRLWAKQYASSGESKWFGYLLTQPQPQPAFLGGTKSVIASRSSLTDVISSQ